MGEATTLYEVALDGSKHALGEKDPGTLTTLANMAVVRDHASDLSVAEALYKEALEGFCEMFGSGHILTLQIRANLAGF